MKKAAYISQKIFFALGTVCTVTVFGGSPLHALDRVKSRVLAISAKTGSDSRAVVLGYAAEEARRILREEGVHEALIQMGGISLNIGSIRRVGAQDPFGKAGECFAFVDLKEKAMMTLCAEPAAISKADALASVTLIGDNAVQLGALCTAALKLSVQDAMSLLNDTEVEAIFVTKAQQVYTTAGLFRSSEVERRTAA